MSTRVRDLRIRSAAGMVPVPDGDGMTALMAAISGGHLAVVRVLCAVEGLDINQTTTNGDTALLTAVHAKQGEAVREILAVESVDVNLGLQRIPVYGGRVSADNRSTALMLAAASGQLEVVRALLAHARIDVNVGTQLGTALSLAAGSGHEEVVRALLAVPNLDANACGYSAYRHSDNPLMKAAEHGHAEIVRMLLAANVDSSTEFGRWPALMHAAGGPLQFGGDSHGSGDVETVRLLLAVPGVDVNAKYEHFVWEGYSMFTHGFTVLMHAAEKGHAEIVKALLEVDGIDVNAADGEGVTALTFAALGRHTEVVLALLAVPTIDVNAGHPWPSALFFASVFGDVDIVRALVATGRVDINALIEYYDVDEMRTVHTTALMGAAAAGTAEVVSVLLAVRLAQPFVSLRLTTAAWRDSDSGIVEAGLCVEAGLRVNVVDDDGDTALIIAARNGHAEVVRALVAAPRVEVNQENSAGDTALTIAAAGDRTDVVSALLAAPGVNAPDADTIMESRERWRRRDAEREEQREREEAMWRSMRC